MCKDAVKIFWTGGWDSTFRVLQLVIVFKKRVQPYYIQLEDGREAEVKARNQIQQKLFDLYPETRERLLPTIQEKINDIPGDEAIRAAFEVINKKNFLAKQYEFLAMFCREHNFDDVELAIEKTSVPWRLLKNYVKKEGKGAAMTYKIDSHFADEAEYKVFRSFSFPVFDITKHDMIRISERNGFKDFMNMTCFCYSPGKNGVPCGVCNPCIFTMKEGLSWRFPFYSKLRYYFRVLPRIKNLLKKNPRLYWFLKKNKG
jgi:hypothetical protein